MPKAHTNNRGWWRQHFHDHLKLTIKDPDAYVSGKVKVYCKVCFDKDISSLLVEDKRDAQGEDDVDLEVDDSTGAMLHR